MTNPLFSCRVKIDRAYKHLFDFQSGMEAFSRRNPNAVLTDELSEPGIKIDRFNLREPIPVEFSSIIGDIAHNLVSALDSLAVSLVRHANIEPVTEEVMRETYFPIKWSDDFSDPKTLRFFKRIGPKAETIIRSLAPYKGGRGENLFNLYRLNIIDKHRAIVPVASGFVTVHYIVPLRDDIPVMPPRDADGKRLFPLKYGDVLTRRVFHEREYYANAHFTLDVAFGEGQVLEGRSVYPALGDFINDVEGVITSFATDIFGIADW